MRVLLDTNFLLLPFQNHLDIFDGIERLLSQNAKFLVLESSLQELRSLKGREKLYGRAMLDFIAKQGGKFEIIQAKGKTDELVFKYAEKHNGEEFYVATMDKILRDKLRRIRVKCIAVKGKGNVQLI